jgi:hypothetical protein
MLRWKWNDLDSPGRGASSPLAQHICVQSDRFTHLSAVLAPRAASSATGLPHSTVPVDFVRGVPPRERRAMPARLRRAPEAGRGDRAPDHRGRNCPLLLRERAVRTPGVRHQARADPHNQVDIPRRAPRALRKGIARDDLFSPASVVDGYDS